MTCPEKAYQVEVENSACVIQLRPVWPAVLAVCGELLIGRISNSPHTRLVSAGARRFELLDGLADLS